MRAKAFIAPHGYRRHRPEATVRYQLVAEHYPRFRDRRAAEGRALPRYVEDKFEAYLRCGLLEHGFLRVKCDACRPKSWSHSVASAAASARAAARGGWPRRRRCSWTTSCHSSPFSSGCRRCRLRCNTCWQRGIERILEHLGRDAESLDPAHPSRVPPEPPNHKRPGRPCHDGRLDRAAHPPPGCQPPRRARRLT